MKPIEVVAILIGICIFMLALYPPTIKISIVEPLVLHDIAPCGEE